MSLNELPPHIDNYFSSNICGSHEVHARWRAAHGLRNLCLQFLIIPGFMSNAMFRSSRPILSIGLHQTGTHARRQTSEALWSKRQRVHTDFDRPANTWTHSLLRHILQPPAFVRIITCTDYVVTRRLGTKCTISRVSDHSLNFLYTKFNINRFPTIIF
jgi:hypothetical protein